MEWARRPAATTKQEGLPMAKKRKGVFARDIDKLNMWFAIVAIGAMLSVFWMIWDDYARPWKSYQRQFQVIQNEVTQQQLMPV